ncbi:MAG: hypothetical protein N2Z58_00340 [Fervidobacterium sp.]|nr:hypothetical protein [Fervidobacterium sp.]
MGNEKNTDEFLAELENMIKSEKEKACPECLKCGWCCKHTICYYGEWDYGKNQCKFLTSDNLCSMYEEIKKLEEEMKLEIRLFGSGCCLNYANPERMKLISKSSGKK